MILISFKNELNNFLKDYEKLIILGVGNELKCDDGVGSFIINNLANQQLNDNILLIDAKTVPENFTGKIKSINPTHIIIVDACLMGCVPGEFKIVDSMDFKTIGISTHSMSLSFFVNYLKQDSNFKILFIGIEPESMDWNFELSRAVENSAYELIDILKEIL